MNVNKIENDYKNTDIDFVIKYEALQPGQKYPDISISLKNPEINIKNISGLRYDSVYEVASVVYATDFNRDFDIDEEKIKCTIDRPVQYTLSSSIIDNDILKLSIETECIENNELKRYIVFYFYPIHIREYILRKYVDTRYKIFNSNIYNDIEILCTIVKCGHIGTPKEYIIMKDGIDYSKDCKDTVCDFPNKITDHLYLGSMCSRHPNILKLLNIKLVITFADEIDSYTKEYTDKLGIRNIQYKLKDLFNLSKDDIVKNVDLFKNHVPNAYINIENAIRENNNVLVHCRMGISRSASLVIFYIMRKMNLNYYQAEKYVRSRRIIINPNQGFVSVLTNTDAISHINSVIDKTYNPKLQTRPRSVTETERCTRSTLPSIRPLSTRQRSVTETERTEQPILTRPRSVTETTISDDILIQRDRQSRREMLLRGTTASIHN